MVTHIAQALLEAQSRGVDRLDAQLLLLHVLGHSAHDRAWLLAHDTDVLPSATQATLDAMVQRRSGGEPLAYITGHKEFFGLDLQVDARVLVPRPDTETLVEWALAVLDEASVPSKPMLPDARDTAEPALPGRWYRPLEGEAPQALRGCFISVIDLGTGSGAVALALKHARPGVQVSATDASSDALQVAQANAQRLQLQVAFVQGSWLTPIENRYHAIVSNPPYIAARDRHLTDLVHEPRQALASGEDGLDDIRQIVLQARAHLHPGGWLLLEHGYDQAAAVRDLLRDAGLGEVQSRRDLGGIERCSGARAPRAAPVFQ